MKLHLRRSRLMLAALLLGAAALAIALIVTQLYPRGISPRGDSPGAGSAALPTHAVGTGPQGPRLVATLRDPGEVGQVAFSPDGKSLATISENPGSALGTVRLWNLSSDRNTVTIASPSMSMAWSPDSRTLVTGADSTGIQLWDAATGEVSAQFSTPPGTASRAIAVSPDGGTRATVLQEEAADGGGSSTVLLLSMPSGTEQAMLATNFDQVRALAFSHDGATLAAAGWDTGDPLYAGTPVSLWNLATDGPVSTLRGQAHFSTRADSVAFSPDDRTLAEASDAGGAGVPYAGVQLWDLASGTAATLTATGGGAVAFSPDGSTLATANTGGRNVQLWDTTTRRLITTITLPSSPAGTVPFGVSSTLAFSPDGKTLAIPDGDTIQLWSTGALTATTTPSPIPIQRTPVPASTALPVLYNLGGGFAAVWNSPQVKPLIFYIFADGLAAITGMHWASWNDGPPRRVWRLLCLRTCL